MTRQEFRKLHKKFTPALYHFAKQLTEDPVESEDLVQETALKAFRSRHTFRQDSSYKSWVFTILKNTFINKYHKRKRRGVVHKPVEELSFAIDQKGMAKNKGYSNLRIQEIKSNIEQLSYKSKMPLLMHAEGYQYNEIAETLDIPIGTVKSRISFARQKLRKKLKESALAS